MKKLLILLLMVISTNAYAQNRVIFLHHSTGRNLLNRGDVRTHLASLNPNIRLWDHDYNLKSYCECGLHDADGVWLNRDYDLPNNAGDLGTDVRGLHILWTGNYAGKDSLLTYDVIVFKSCFPNARISSDAMLQDYQTWYTDIISELQFYSDKKFLLLGFPPLIRERTTVEEADRARTFINWLETQCSGNVYFMPYFDLLADETNCLKVEYQISANDSHPNSFADSVVGPIFAQYISSLVGGISGVPLEDDEFKTWGNLKGLYYEETK